MTNFAIFLQIFCEGESESIKWLLAAGSCAIQNRIKKAFWIQTLIWTWWTVELQFLFELKWNEIQINVTVF